MASNVLPIKPNSQRPRGPSQVAFQRTELNLILSLYGQMVSNGDWKDYAIDMLTDRAEFSIYRRATETPLYRIIKTPALAKKQGAYSVMAPGGLILKRGHELKAVLRVFDKQRFKLTR
ncbi:MAG: DUF2794 domain-containing protein [Robiginitomaculum sp.]